MKIKEDPKLRAIIDKVEYKRVKLDVDQPETVKLIKDMFKNQNMTAIGISHALSIPRYKIYKVLAGK